jgi:hypothetical protein
MDTIDELEKFLKEKHPELDYFLVGNFGKYGMYGFGLEKFGSLFVWFYYEREGRQNLEYFKTEEKAVSFALKEIKKQIKK